MTPQNFAERMRYLVQTTTGEQRVRDALAFDLMLDTLAESGFHEGINVLVNASGEKLSPATVAKAVARG